MTSTHEELIQRSGIIKTVDLRMQVINEVWSNSDYWFFEKDESSFLWFTTEM